MDPTHPPLPKSQQPSLSWHERLLHWSGWERMVEYRWQLIGGTLLVVLFVWLFGWFMARRQSSSVVDTLRAEMMVYRLKNPGAAPGTPATAVDVDFHRLEELCPPQTALGKRFSGVLAQEQILQDIRPLSAIFFSTAAETLSEAQLPLHGACTQAAMATGNGKNDEALKCIDKILEKTGDQFPQLHGYALLQKAALLCQLKRPNGATIEELREFVASHPQVEKTFDIICAGRTQELLSLLTIE